jgi:hypothetical protein
VENLHVGKYVSNLMLDLNDRLEESVLEIRKRCSLEESKTYGMAVGKVICTIFDEILDPLYLKHPTLKPPGLD